MKIIYKKRVFYCSVGEPAEGSLTRVPFFFLLRNKGIRPNTKKITIHNYIYI